MKIIYIILFLIFSISISLGQSPFEEGSVSVSNTPFFETDEDGGGASKSLIYLNIDLVVPKTEINRTEKFLLTIKYNIDNEGKKPNITNFYYPIYLNKLFKVVKINGNAVPPIYGEIGIGGKLNGSENKSKNWTLETIKEINKGPIFLLDSNRRNFEKIDAKSDRKNLLISSKIKYYINKSLKNSSNIKLYIKNNAPRINETETKVTIINETQTSDNNELIYWNTNNPLEVSNFVSAYDLESSETLSYTWILDDGDVERYFETNQTISSFQWNLKSNKDYTFKVKARDVEGNYSNTIVAKILSGNKTFYKLSTPSWSFFSINLVLITFISLAILLILLISVFNKLKSQAKFCVRKPKDFYRIFIFFITKKSFSKAIALILSITFLFILLFNSEINIWHIYTTSLAFYELYIYIIVLIIFSYLTDDVFFKKGNNITKYYLPVINNVFMILILVSFYGIISGINQDIYEHLIRYYQIVIEVSGTLLGLILGFYVAKFDNNRSDAYLKALEYLVILYGSLIGLSLWGLSLGANISFTPLIKFNIENIPNIFSIWVFEATLLMVPLAITSLYRLIKVDDW